MTSELVTKKAHPYYQQLSPLATRQLRLSEKVWSEKGMQIDFYQSLLASFYCLICVISI